MYFLKNQVHTLKTAHTNLNKSTGSSGHSLTLRVNFVSLLRKCLRKALLSRACKHAGPLRLPQPLSPLLVKPSSD